MIALGIIILILILLLILPVGADAAYVDGSFTLKVKAGPLRISILPSKAKESGEKKAKKQKKTKKTTSEGGKDEEKKAKKPKQKLSFEDIKGIIRLGLEALGRFRRSISVDELMLHLVTAGPDPYSAVMNYGYFNACFGTSFNFTADCIDSGLVKTKASFACQGFADSTKFNGLFFGSFASTLNNSI